MTQARIRKPAFQAPMPPAAVALDDDPATRLEAMYRRIRDTRMQDMPFLNPALSVEAVGFRRHAGDWVGAVITPWFLNLFVLPGGGLLWSDRPSGERVKIPFPVGELEFIADHDTEAEVPASQYCPLFAPVDRFATQEAARAAAEAALQTIFTPPPRAADTAAGTNADLPENAANGTTDTPPPVADRRAFFRRLAGRPGGDPHA